MYQGVPTTCPAAVRLLLRLDFDLAAPKSRSLTHLDVALAPLERKMLAGLMSRWTIPLA